MPKFVTSDILQFYEDGKMSMEMSAEEMTDTTYNWLYFFEPGDLIFGKDRPKRTVESISLIKDGFSEEGKRYTGSIYRVELRTI